MARLKELEGRTGIRDSVAFDPRVIVVEVGHNPRNYDLPENRAHLDELKASIREHGVLQPLWVRNNGDIVTLVDGECRLRAVLELIANGVEIVSVPTLEVKGANEADRLILALTANTGKSLSKWEVGAAYTKLLNYGWVEEMIAKRMGQTVRFVKEAIELSDAPEEMKHLLSQQAVTPSLALSEMRSKGPAKGTESVKAKVAASKGKQAKRDRVVSVDVKALKIAAMGILDEADMDDPDAALRSISREAIHALRAAMGLK